MSIEPVYLAQRDASWLNRPNVRSVKQLHRIVDGCVAGCNRRMLLVEDQPWLLTEAPEDLRCRRRGCFAPPAPKETPS